MACRMRTAPQGRIRGDRSRVARRLGDHRRRVRSAERRCQGRRSRRSRAEARQRCDRGVARVHRRGRAAAGEAGSGAQLGPSHRSEWPACRREDLRRRRSSDRRERGRRRSLRGCSRTATPRQRHARLCWLGACVATQPASHGAAAWPHRGRGRMTSWHAERVARRKPHAQKRCRSRRGQQVPRRPMRSALPIEVLPRLWRTGQDPRRRSGWRDRAGRVRRRDNYGFRRGNSRSRVLACIRLRSGCSPTRGQGRVAVSPRRQWARGG